MAEKAGVSELMLIRQAAARDVDNGSPLNSHFVAAWLIVAMVDEILENRDLKPRYDHDCKFCRYLGPHNIHDLYICQTATSGTAFVARWGDRPYDHKFVEVTQVTANNSTDPEFIEAKKRAVNRGWFVP